MTLYKYCPPSRVDVLENGLIRFTHPAALNDPLDLRPPLGTLLTSRDAEGTLDLLPGAVEGKLAGAYDQLPAEARGVFSEADFRRFAREVLSSPEGQRLSGGIVQHGLNLMNVFTPNFREQLYSMLDESVGVLSLSEVWDSEPMWAHYADQGRGLVIALDARHGFFSRQRSPRDEMFHLRRVIYVPRSKDPRAISDLAKTEMLLEKSESWSYEREWRMLVPLADAELTVGAESDPIHLFRLPAEAIVEVIVGMRGDDELVSKLVAAMSQRPELAHVHFSRASLSFTTGQLGKVPLTS